MTLRAVPACLDRSGDEEQQGDSGRVQAEPEAEDQEALRSQRGVDAEHGVASRVKLGNGVEVVEQQAMRRDRRQECAVDHCGNEQCRRDQEARRPQPARSGLPARPEPQRSAEEDGSRELRPRQGRKTRKDARSHEPTLTGRRLVPGASASRKPSVISTARVAEYV